MFEMVYREEETVSCIWYGMIYEYGPWAISSPAKRERQLPYAISQSQRSDPVTLTADDCRGYIKAGEFSRSIFSPQAALDSHTASSSAESFGQADFVLPGYN